MALSSKRRYAALSGIVAVALTATACGGGGTDDPSDPGASRRQQDRLCALHQVR